MADGTDAKSIQESLPALDSPAVGGIFPVSEVRFHGDQQKGWRAEMRRDPQPSFARSRGI
jgi:hypothetical protein